MIESTRGPSDLIFNRSRLEEQLIDECDGLKGRILNYGGHPVSRADNLVFGKNLGKVLFHIIDERLASNVRHQFAKLKRLHEDMEKRGIDITAQSGLWLPALADQEAGDTQANITISPGWVTYKKDTGKVLQSIMKTSENLAQKVRREYGTLPYLLICCKRGRDYRITITGETRNPDAESSPLRGREKFHLNDFAIAIGDELKINDPVKNRFRKKRIDAWRGVEIPLAEYKTTSGDGKWLVYPPREDVLPE